jgi:hypothetical protein
VRRVDDLGDELAAHRPAVSTLSARCSKNHSRRSRVEPGRSRVARNVVEQDRELLLGDLAQQVLLRRKVIEERLVDDVGAVADVGDLVASKPCWSNSSSAAVMMRSRTSLLRRSRR